MMKKSLFLAGILFSAVFSGCISYEYTGEKKPPTPDDVEVRVFENAARIQQEYTVLGKATVSADYNSVTRDRMIGKLADEARECGADAVLLVEQQVIPTTPRAPRTAAFTNFDNDEPDQSVSQIYRDLDQNYLNTRRDKNAALPEGDTVNFRRIIQAQFIKYKK